MKNKIFIIHSSEFLSGGERVSLSIYEGLKNEFEFVFFSQRKSGFLESLGTKNYFSSSLFLPCVISDLYKFVIKENPDIIHAHGIRAGFMLKIILPFLKWKKRRIITVYTVHGLHFLHRKNIKNACMIFFEKMSNRFIDKIVCVGDDDGKLFLSENLADSSRIIVIKNGVDIRERILNDIPDDIKKFTEGKIVIGTVARLHYQKDVLTIIRAMNLLDRSRFCFVVVGSGPDLDRLKDEVNRLRLPNVIFVGDGKNTITYIDKVFDIFVLSTRWEGLSIALLEAMMLKKPVIASRVHGVTELVKENETGLLFNFGDFTDLKKNINFVIENKEKVEAMCENAKNMVNKFFTLSVMVSEYKKLYESLLFKIYENPSDK